ncbi:MAG: hypothetical protein K1Y02_23260 [Candidatus Hydrogenedentes bacterium]|nr:hypothetical protein [Candidatus Hydrogenedentota bacterium]
MENNPKTSSCAGFSLVELALALLVAGLGVLSIFNMFPQGLDSCRKSTEMGEISAFASWVLDSLQAQSLVIAPSNTWDTQFKSGGTYAEVPKSHSMAFVTTTQPVVRALGFGSAGVEAFTVAPQFHQTLGVDSGYALSTFTYTLDVQSRGTATKYARLEVWAGDKQQAVKDAINNSTRKPAGSIVFYREFVPRYL